MAPLKLERMSARHRDGRKYPWLKGHGSIEAAPARAAVPRASTYPWLKGHGYIEAPNKIGGYAQSAEYPWLKGHGSIEAASDAGLLDSSPSRIHG